MAIQDEIMNAVGAHGAWKMRLKLAIDTGSSEFQPSAVQQDDQCPFGKWLYGCPANVKSDAEYEKVRQFHAAFHKVASKVLLMALSKNKTEAEKSVGPGGEFTRASSDLSAALLAWKTRLQA